jgi:di/tricarboxylate transporter
LELPLNIELILALTLLLSSVASFALEKVRMELTAICLIGSILILSFFGWENWPSANDLKFVLASEAPIAIIAMFVVSAALGKQGIIETITTYLQKLTRLGYNPFLLVLLSAVAISSAFVNNTPVVVILLPVAIALSKTLEVPSSKLLIPISYASIFGGCCTLIGTSTNIIASGFMSNSSLYPNMGPMKMFDLTPIGLPLLFLGICFLILFGRKLLPEREALSKIIAEIEHREFLAEAIVVAGSPLVGNSIKDSPISEAEGVRLLDIVRQGKSILSSPGENEFYSGDRLILTCKPQGLINASEFHGIEIFNQTELGVEQIKISQAVMVEAMVKPTSDLVSTSLREANIRGRYNLAVVALHRKGKNLRQSLDNLKLEAGDTLLLLGSEGAVERFRESKEAILLDKPPIQMKKQPIKALLSIGSLVTVIGIASFGLLPLHVAATVCAVVLLVTKCINWKEACKAVEWNLLVLIYAMLCMGMVMEKSGASLMLADSIKTACIMGFPLEWQIIGALVVIYCFTAFMTELLSNNATIAIMAPVALSVAHQFGLDSEVAKAFVFTCCIAASASFITPIGYQTNTFVYTVGGYRFKDFTNFGVWPMMLYFVGTITLVCWYWGLFPNK